jgi:VanZ family protein
MRSATGLLTRGSLPRRLPGLRQWLCGGGASPLTAAGPSRIRTGFPHRAPDCGRAYHRTVSRSHARLWLPVVAWAAVIFALSSVPDLGTGLGGWDLVLRKIAHAAEYAVLGALLVRATRRTGLAFALGTLYAVSDELHQSFVPGRLGWPIDVAIDAVGVAVGIALWHSVRARRLA